MNVALAIGHAGKPDRPFDRGTSYIHPSNVHLREVPLARAYGSAIDDELLSHGSYGVLYSDGSYDQRSARAKAAGADCLLALHVNAGLGGRPGQRAELFYWPGNAEGERLAQCLGDALGAMVSYPVRVLAAAPGPYLEAARVPHVRATIDGVEAPSVCVEPFFLDALGADELVTPRFLEAVGKALAKGLLAWQAGRQ